MEGQSTSTETENITVSRRVANKSYPALSDPVLNRKLLIALGIVFAVFVFGIFVGAVIHIFI